MALHIQDKVADALVRDFARRRGVGITAAIKLAVNEATDKEREGAEDLRRKIEPILAQVRANRKQPYSTAEDKAFMDDMWGENDR